MSGNVPKGPRYRRVLPSLWWNPSFTDLSASAKVLFFDLRTGPQTTMVPGLLRFSLAVAEEETGLTLNTLKRAMAEIVNAKLGRYDSTARVFYTPLGLEEQPPDNYPHAIAWGPTIRAVPDCETKREALSNFDTFVVGKWPDCAANWRDAIGLPRGLPSPQGGGDQQAGAGAGAEAGTGTESSKQEREPAAAASSPSGLFESERETESEIARAIGSAVAASSLRGQLRGLNTRTLVSKALEHVGDRTPIERAIASALSKLEAKSSAGKARNPIGLLLTLFEEQLDPAKYVDPDENASADRQDLLNEFGNGEEFLDDDAWERILSEFPGVRRGPWKNVGDSYRDDLERRVLGHLRDKKESEYRRPLRAAGKAGF